MVLLLTPRICQIVDGDERSKAVEMIDEYRYVQPKIVERETSADIADTMYTLY